MVALKFNKRTTIIKKSIISMEWFSHSIPRQKLKIRKDPYNAKHDQTFCFNAHHDILLSVGD